MLALQDRRVTKAIPAPSARKVRRVIKAPRVIPESQDRKDQPETDSSPERY